MKIKFLLIACLFGNHQISIAQENEDVQTKSMKVLELLKNSEADSLYQLMSSAMQGQVQSSMLKGIWGQLSNQVGTFLGQDTPSLEQSDGFQIVTIPLQFERAYLNMRLTWDADYKLAGFFFLPGQNPASAYKIPSYANIETITEEDWTIGQSPFQLKAKLSLPQGKGPYPLVILVHGSGPHDMDESIGPNKPFKDLALGLASSGIAVLRYDKRTFAHGSKMDVENMSPEEEVIQDALWAIDQAKKDDRIQKNAMFIAGHSLGGMLAPAIAHKSPQLAGYILLASNARPLEETVLDQIVYLNKYHPENMNDSIAQQMKGEMSKVQAQRKNPNEDIKELSALGMGPAYWSFLLNYNQVNTLQKEKRPVLILHAGRDYQVNEREWEVWKEATKKMRNAHMVKIEGLNHLLIAGKGLSLPAEYNEPGNVDERVIKEIREWIEKH